jgi:SagB-type dehydrogenase family enzyme
LSVNQLYHANDATSSSSIDLPTPQKSGDVLLDEVLGFEPKDSSPQKTSITLADLTQMLWAGQGISHFPLRTVPSAGGTYPLDLYVSLNSSIDQVKGGTYRYLPIDHTIEEWSDSHIYDYIESICIHNTSCQLPTESIILLITADYERTTSKYGSRGVQYVHLEVGHLLQNLQLQARSLGIYSQLVLNFNETIIKSLIGVDYTPLAVVILGGTETQPIDMIPTEKQSTLKMCSVSSSVSVEEAINARKSTRQYKDRALTELELSDLTELSYYRKDPFTGNLVYNSITQVLPVNLYLSIDRVEGITPGIYRFNSHERRFYQLTNDSRRFEIYEESLHQIWVLEAPVVLIWALNQSKLAESPWPMSIQKRLAMFEVGTIAQNVYLKSYSLGLGTVVVGAFSETRIQNLASMSSDELPIYVMPIGKITDIHFGDFIIQSIEWWDALFAWLCAAFIYSTCIIMTPPFRRKLKGVTRWFHFGFGFFILLFGLLHLILQHGGWFMFTHPTFSRIRNFIYTAWFNITIDDNSNLNDLGLAIARVVLWMATIFIIQSVISFFAPLNERTREILKVFHKYSGYTVGVGICVHLLINGIWVKTSWVYFILISSVCLYLLLYNYYNIEYYVNKYRSMKTRK